ncbi:MAG: ThiF family adenylyltransferase [Candidatus Hodarchaeales archaeon]
MSDAGGNLRKISRATVLIKVGDINAQEVCQHPVYNLLKALGAVGFGSIYLCGAADYFDDLDFMMQGANFIQIPGLWFSQHIARAAPRANIIVNLTNDFESGPICAYVSASRSCNYLQLVWGPCWVTASGRPIESAELGKLPKSNSKTYTPATIASIVSGLALQEVLMNVSDMELFEPIAEVVIYNMAANDRISTRLDQLWSCGGVKGKTVELIGAGAVGSHTLECLVPMLNHGCELRIFDYDDVGVENLAIQTVFSEKDVGRPKAEVMTEKLQRMSRGPKIEPFVMPYQEYPTHLSRPSLRVVCPDNWKARKYANDLSIQHDGVPLVEAASSAEAAIQRSYYPGITACLEHRIPNFAKKAATEKEPESCGQSTAPTLPGTNMVIAGILAAEAMKALVPEQFGLVSKGCICYDVRCGRRFRVINEKSPCSHDVPQSRNPL